MATCVTIHLNDSGPRVVIDGDIHCRERVGELIEILDALGSHLPMQSDQLPDRPTPISLETADG